MFRRKETPPSNTVGAAQSSSSSTKSAGNFSLKSWSGGVADSSTVSTKSALRSSPRSPSSTVASSAAAQLANDKPEWVRVGEASTMHDRTEVRVHKRRITILRTPGVQKGEPSGWTAVDAVCYHAGGPIGPQGTLTVVDNRVCLRCPWHSYLVDVYTGEGVYKAMDGKMCSKGVRQRVHEVQQWPDGSVWVRLADARVDKVASDEYAFAPKYTGITSDYYDVPALDW